MANERQLAISCSALLLLLAPIGLGACAGRMARPAEEPLSSTKKPPSPEQNALNNRLEAIEAKLAAMNEKEESTRATLEGMITTRDAHPSGRVGVPGRASDTVGLTVGSRPLVKGSDSGFVIDEAIQLYRKGQIFLQARKFPEAIESFAQFLEKNPDHALAGSAQYSIGLSYWSQNDYRRAETELFKVVTSYDRSVHISDALRLLSETETKLGKTEKAAKYRQQLTSLFANSPAALQISQAKTPMETAPHLVPQETAQPAEKDSATQTDSSYDEPPPTTPITAPVSLPGNPKAE